MSADQVRIRRLLCDDPDLVAGANETNDPVSFVRSCLTMGAKVLRLAHTSVDTVALRDELDGVTHRFTDAVIGAVDRFATLSSQLVDGETGALARRDAELLKQLRTLLGATFDPTRTDSVLATIEQALTRAGDRTSPSSGCW